MSITGTAKVGETLTAVIHDGYSLLTPAYQWMRAPEAGGEPVDIGTNQNAYVPVATDVENRIRVKVTYKFDSGSTLVRESEPTVVVVSAGYTVTFNANAGGDTFTSLPAPITGVVSGATVTQPATNPARAGYVFGGWYKEAAATNAWSFGTDTVTTNVTLYAKWTRVVAAKYRFTDGNFSNTSYVSMGTLTLGENTITTSTAGINLTGVYTEEGGLYTYSDEAGTNDAAHSSTTWAYLYDGSGKIGIVQIDDANGAIVVNIGQASITGIGAYRTYYYSPAPDETGYPEITNSGAARFDP